MKTELTAIIDIGSTAIRLVVAEITDSREWRIIDRAEKPVLLGRDVFRGGSISKKSINQCFQILHGFREITDSYTIDPKRIHALGTSALRGAKNRDTFLDRVTVRTGINIKVVEGIEENRLTYLATRYAIGDSIPHLSRSNSLIIEVGGGSTEIMMLQRGKIVAAHSLGVGTVRIEDELKISAQSGKKLEQVLKQRIETMSEVLNEEMELERIRFFIAVGGDARLAAQRKASVKHELYSIVEKNDFKDLINQVSNLTPEECSRELGISLDQADGLLPALLMYHFLMNRTNADKLIVPNISIREGYLLSLTLDPDSAAQEDFHSQIIASAYNLGKKFHFGDKHARQVTKLALTLFDLLQNEHTMVPHSRLLLEVAALLHDIGTYIRTSGHHKHGQYIISNSEVFGLNTHDISIVSNVVRYHRKAAPNPSHLSYISLAREDRIRVMKLASILRVADALDRGHTQRISIKGIEEKEGMLILQCEYSGDISIERMGLARKANMFEEIFGMTVGLA